MTSTPYDDAPLPTEEHDVDAAVPVLDTRQHVDDDIAEASVLGAMLQDRTALYDALATLDANAFVIDRHRVVFEALSDIATGDRADSVEVDSVVLADHLVRHGDLDRVGGIPAVMGLTDGVANPRNIKSYVRLVMERHIRREFVRLSAEAAQSGSDAPDVQNTIDELVDRLNQLNEATRLESSTMSIADAADAALKKAKDIEESGTGLLGIDTGLRDLNAVLRGFQGGKFYIVAARPAIGKSLVALHFAKAAARTGHRTLFSSFEMGGPELASRILISEARVPGDHVKGGELSPQEWDKLEQAKASVSEWPLLIEDSTLNPSLMAMQAAVNRHASAEGGLGLIIVDYLQLIEHSTANRGANRQEVVSSISRAMKLMARRYDVPVIALSQLSRQVESRPDKRPMLSDLRESGSLEQDADAVVMLYRDDAYDPDSPQRGEMELNVVKHRDGATGLVRVAAVLSSSAIADLALGDPSRHAPPPEEDGGSVPF